MDVSLQNKIVSFIWSIADDCLRDVYVRGKYRDVILPMFVLRRLDCLLEGSKEAVVEEMRFQREEAGFSEVEPIALCEITGYVFFNTADWTLKKLVKTESNIRRYIIENDWLEAIIQLPNNLFYNTGITTYIWVLSNRKAAHRRGKVQLIDASGMYQKLRKNLGAKNCEFAPEQIEKITHLYLEMQPAVGAEGKGISKIFDNRDFGYYKVTVDRPLRLAAQFTAEKLAQVRFIPALREVMEWAYEKWGEEIYSDLKSHQVFLSAPAVEIFGGSNGGDLAVRAGNGRVVEEVS